MVRESRHLWVGNLPENLRDDQIVEYFSRFGRVEKVKILPKKSPDGGLAAFVDFVDIRSATKANETTNYMGDRELRTNYNEPGNHPSMMGEGRGRGRPHMYDRGRGGYGRRERPAPSYSDEDGPRRGRYPYNDRPSYTHKRPRIRKDSGGSHDSDRPSSPKFARNRSVSVSSQSERGRSSSPNNDSYSGSDAEARGKSISPSRSSVNASSQKNTSIQIKNISTRPGDNSIKEALFHEFKKVGEIVNIKIVGSEKERYALVKFRRSEDAEKGLQSNNKTFLGNEMKISLFKGENKDKEGEANFSLYRKNYRSKEFGPEDVQFDPMATRTLFVGNLDKMLTHGELRKIFEKFGDVVDVDIKKQNPGITTYAFLQYVDINGAMRAKQRMDREIIRGNRVKVGFGRGTPTNTIWIGNVAQNSTENQMQRQFHPFGFVTRVIIDRQCWQGLVSFDTIDAATYAFENMRGRYVLGRKLLVDFASRSCKEGFYGRMERTGQLDRRTLEPSPPPPRPGSGVHSGFMQSGYSGRGRGFRGGFNKGYSYTGKYGQGSERSGHGEFRDFPQGSQEYFQESYYPDEDYDDYEKELRDYGYRQRERERESGRRQERDSSRTRDREYSGRERQRERKRAYTPLTDDDHAQSIEQKSDDDDDDVYSEKDIQSKIVKPSAGEMKRKRSEDDSPGLGNSPDAAEDVDRKAEKKDKKKKREKKRKSIKGTGEAGMEKDVEPYEDDVIEEKKAKDADVKTLKAEKKKKRKLSEKGLAAEEKARRKELRKLKKLMKLQAELGRSEDFQQKLLLGEAGMDHLEKEVEARLPVEDDGGFQLAKDVDNRESSPIGVDENLVGSKHNRRKEENGAVNEERSERFEKERQSESDSDKEKLEELEKKREELRKLEEAERRTEDQHKAEEKRPAVGEDKQEVIPEDDGIKLSSEVAVDAAKASKSFESVNSDSDQSDLIIDESLKSEANVDDAGSKKKLAISEKDVVDSEKEVVRSDKEDVEVHQGSELKDSEMKIGVVDEALGEEIKAMPKDEKDVATSSAEGKDESSTIEESEVKVKTEVENESEVLGSTVDESENSTKKHAEAEDKVELTGDQNVSKIADQKVEDVKEDIYSSESDSSDDLDNIDDDDDDDNLVIESAKTGKSKDDLETPLSPDRTPPTPDLEEDSLDLRTKLQMPIYGMYQKAYPADGKPASGPESDEEKTELERSMKEANYRKRKVETETHDTDRDKRRTKKDKLRTRKFSTSSEHDSDSVKSASDRRARSPSDRKSKTDERFRRASPPKRSTLDRVEAIERSLKGPQRDSPDWRDRKEPFPRRDRGESPRRRDIPGRRRNSLETMHRAKSPEFRRASPDRRDIMADRGRREAFGNRGSPDRSLSPRRRRSLERRLNSQRSRDGKEARVDRRRDEEYRPDDRDMRAMRDQESREPREMRENREAREREMRDHDGRHVKENRDARDVREREMREGRDFRDTRDARDKSFRPVQNESMREKDRLTRERSYNRDREMPGRGPPRNEVSERGIERGRGSYREGVREAERPLRHTPPVPTDQRSRSPARYSASVGDRTTRTPEVRPEGIRPRTPEQARPRSPAMRPGERRRGRSAERRVSPPRAHEPERAPYRDQGERRDRDRRDRGKDETPPPPPPPPEPRKEKGTADPSMLQQQQMTQQRTFTAGLADSPSGTPGSMITPNPPTSGSTPTPVHFTPPPPPPPTNADSLLDLLRRYPVMWQGLFALKNDSAAVQMHYISGNARLAEASLPRSVLAGEVPPPLRISQRMKLEASQLEGVNKRIKSANEHCMLLALPCGRDPLDVHAQTRALKTGFITYLQVKQAAGIINIVNSATKQPAYVLHIFPPCEFAEVHLARVAPDLLDSAADSGHLMVLITPV